MTAPTNNVSFYADFNGLAALKRDAKADGSKALRAAAQQFESLFTAMMLKSMRAANPGDAMTGSNDMDFYQGMFDQQLAVQMSKGRGLGLADMLVQQLTRSGLVPPNADQPVGRVTTRLPGAVADVEDVEDVGLQPDLQPDLQPNLQAAPATSSSKVDSPIAATRPATPAEFVAQMLPHAEAAAAQLGVEPTTLVAHAALETGWGRHVPQDANGRSSFNLFGIKATPAWQGASVAATTLEFEQGVAVKRVERFKAYDSPAAAFKDYVEVLSQRRYQGAHANNSEQFAQALQRSGYATDPDYALKLSAVAGTVRAIHDTTANVVAPSVDI